jgi:hypothetical protein
MNQAQYPEVGGWLVEYLADPAAWQDVVDVYRCEVQQISQWLPEVFAP